MKQFINLIRSIVSDMRLLGKPFINYTLVYIGLAVVSNALSLFNSSNQAVNSFNSCRSCFANSRYYLFPTRIYKTTDRECRFQFYFCRNFTPLCYLFYSVDYYCSTGYPRYADILFAAVVRICILLRYGLDR